MSNKSSSSIPIFSGYNYDQWAEKMRTILLGYGLWECVERGYKEANGRNKVKDGKALELIHLGVSPKIFPTIEHATEAKVAWEILRNGHEGKWKSNLQQIPIMVAGVAFAGVKVASKLPHGNDSSDGDSDNLFTYANYSDGGASGIDSDTAGSFLEGIGDMFVSLASFF